MSIGSIINISQIRTGKYFHQRKPSILKSLQPRIVIKRATNLLHLVIPVTNTRHNPSSSLNFNSNHYWFNLLIWSTLLSKLCSNQVLTICREGQAMVTWRISWETGHLLATIFTKSLLRNNNQAVHHIKSKIRHRSLRQLWIFLVKVRQDLPTLIYTTCQTSAITIAT